LKERRKVDLFPESMTEKKTAKQTNKQKMEKESLLMSYGEGKRNWREMRNENHRRIESLRLEKTSKIIKSNHQPITTMPTKMSLQNMQILLTIFP